MGGRILIVDDEPIIITTLRDRLEHLGYDVIVAESASRAEEQCKVTFPDIVLVDVMLPDGNGNELCKKFKSINPDMKIIVMTSKLDAVDAYKARCSGADDFAVKTTDYGMLASALKGLEL